MKAKKIYKQGGPIKGKGMPKAELERDAAMAKTRLKELADEKKYLAKRKEAEREYRMTLKQGGTEAQAEKAANKILDSFKKGGMIAKKKC